MRRSVGPAATPLNTPTATYSPAPYVPSPLSTSWSSAVSTMLPSGVSPSFSQVSNSPLFDFKALSPTSSYCPPNSTTTASPVAMSPAQMSPVITASPLLTTPQMSDSPVFSSPIFTADGEPFEPSSVVQSTATQSGGTFFAANAAGPAVNNGFYTMQAVMSALLAVALFFAFLWAGLAWLARRRQPRQLPYISAPMPQITYEKFDDPEDDLESRYGTERNTTRSSEVPTLPESVLPTRLWRNSGTSVTGGLSEFRKSVEEGFETVGIQRANSMSEKQRSSTVSLGSQPPSRPQRPVSSHQRSRTMDYRSDRLSTSSEPVKLPTTPPQAYSSFDRVPKYRLPTPARTSAEVAKGRPTSNGAYRPAPDVTPLKSESPEIKPVDVEKRPSSPTESVRSKSSAKSSKSMKQALWALRKTAIIASASSSSKKDAKAMEISLPIGRPTQTVIYDADREQDQCEGDNIDLSDSINVVMLDSQRETDTTQVDDGKQRPISQDAIVPRNKLRKRTSSLGAGKARPATVGYTPPAILVTDHPQALVPPPSPKVKRISTYSLCDTLPYTISPSPSLMPIDASHFELGATTSSDVALPDSEGFASEQAVPQDASRHDSMQSNTTSTSASCRSENSMDLATDEEQLLRSQRRRTLLCSVYRQSQSHPDGLNGWTQDFPEPTAAQDVNTTTPLQTPKRNKQAKTNLASTFAPLPTAPLTPPYTPVESRFPASIAAPAQGQVQTPTKRMRSVSAGATSRPVLDASLTRFSRLDLASEFSMSQLSSQASTDGDKQNEAARPSHIANAPGAAVSGSPAIPPRSPKRQSASLQRQEPRIPEEVIFAAPVRRTRSSTVGDKPLATLAAEAMSRASRVPLPIVGKATRISVAPTAVHPSPLPSMPSFAQDLRASVSFPSMIDRCDTRPSSFRTSYTSMGTSDYRRSSVFDMATYASEFPIFTPAPSAAKQRVSNGSLGLPRLDDDDDDEASVCEYRDSTTPKAILMCELCRLPRFWFARISMGISES